ncbi:uncharacterized protein N7487_003414 [Penicillium crustosum]|uniref:uncharacterized protein n=1 Tax=Penicillium crustosum TaxID=36656 RepID=UPI0023884E72|nr:uncharacterized protein N7487_003414 [Penicillium crustosum]KAJ5419864.1 hypothetical protein N7487_003414 [Penicillium crustosum]
MSSPINDFQTLLDSQVGRLPRRSWPVPRGPSKKQNIPINSLRFQGAAWATAGGGMCATLHGAYKIFRNFRGFRYI